MQVSLKTGTEPLWAITGVLIKMTLSTKYSFKKKELVIGPPSNKTLSILNNFFNYFKTNLSSKLFFPQKI